MILLKKYRYIWLAFMLVFSAFGIAIAQETPVVLEGKVRSLGIKADPGTTYYWKIFTDRTLIKEAPVTQV